MFSVNRDEEQNPLNIFYETIDCLLLSWRKLLEKIPLLVITEH